LAAIYQASLDPIPIALGVYLELEVAWEEAAWPPGWLAGKVASKVGVGAQRQGGEVLEKYLKPPSLKPPSLKPPSKKTRGAA